METVFPNSKPKHKPRHLCMAMAQWANNPVSAWIDTQPDMLQAIYWNAECLHQIEKRKHLETPHLNARLMQSWPGSVDIQVDLQGKQVEVSAFICCLDGDFNRFRISW